MKARHSVAKVMRWTHGILFVLLVVLSIIFRANVKPEPMEPITEEQQEEPKIAVFVYVLLFVILSAFTLILLLTK